MICHRQRIFPYWLLPLLAVGCAAIGPSATRWSASSETKEARISLFVPPDYPKEGRDSEFGAIVTLEVAVSSAGEVVHAEVSGSEILSNRAASATRPTSISIRRALRAFEASALEAIKEFEFSPALKNGVPVLSTMTVPISFTLNQ